MPQYRGFELTEDELEEFQKLMMNRPVGVEVLMRILQSALYNDWVILKDQVSQLDRIRFSQGRIDRTEEVLNIIEVLSNTSAKELDMETKNEVIVEEESLLDAEKLG